MQPIQASPEFEAHVARNREIARKIAAQFGTVPQLIKVDPVLWDTTSAPVAEFIRVTQEATLQAKKSNFLIRAGMVLA